MKKILLALFILFLGIAYLTKPDDKTCIIEGTKAVWGKLVPDVNVFPGLFEQYMNIASKDVEVKDWVFWKTVLYKVNNEQKTVAIGAYKNVFALVKPLETKTYIPKMPKQ
jgi:hypothetical protein